MNKLTQIKDTERKFQVITDEEKVGYLLDEYIGKRPLYIKNTSPPAQVEMYNRNSSNKCSFRFPAKHEIDNEFAVYCNYNKQMELECEVEKIDENQADITISAAKIAVAARKGKRYRAQEDTMHADNFLISKNKIDLNPLSYSVSNKVIFHEYERSLATQFPGLRILDLEPSDRSPETILVKKHKQGALISDISHEEEYGEKHPGLANLQKIWSNDLKSQMKAYQEAALKSVLIRPLAYENLKGENFPIGYFLLKSNEKPYTMNDYKALDDAHEKIIERIKDANTIQLNIKQPILDVGLDGVLIKVDDNEFKDLVLNRNDLSFNVVIKMQSPLRFYAEIKHIRQDSEGDLFIGLDFAGTVHSKSVGFKGREMLDQNLKFQLSSGTLTEIL